MYEDVDEEVSVTGRYNKPAALANFSVEMPGRETPDLVIALQSLYQLKKGLLVKNAYL